MEDRRNSGDDRAMEAKTDETLGRCVVVSPRHRFVRPWIRAYFASGNSIPLVIVPGPPGDWRDGDMEYCQAAARYCHGQVFDCSAEWKAAESQKDRANAKGFNVGCYSKKNILHAVATRLAPKSWAWIDDDAEVTGNLDECFDYAEKAPGFVCTQFYHLSNYTPDSIDNRHPAGKFLMKDADGRRVKKLCWNSFMFFHGEANERLKELAKPYPIEDDEVIFAELYDSDLKWHEGFCDFSIRNWQAVCKSLDQLPDRWMGKVIHYTSIKNDNEIKNHWAAKADTLPKAPFEGAMPDIASDGPVDAVFVIGTGSKNNNEELRYALRNLDKNCKFVRDVYISGVCPPWIDKTKVKHLQWPDRFSHAKDANIIDKLRHACEVKGIARRILFCSDDQFQTRECEWKDFEPRYLRKYSPDDTWYNNKHRVWHTRLRKTLQRDYDRRKAAGVSADVYYYQPHMWMQIDRDRFLEYARWCGYERRDDTIIASGYFNYISAGGRQDFDHVFIGSEARIPKETHVAYHDGSYQSAMKILKSLFPDPCRFETAASSTPAPAPKVAPAPAPRPATVRSEDDPAPADPHELSALLRVSAAVRSNVIWHSLLGEVSRAEEMRLFGVKGWRTVWNDIIRRWREATGNGANAVAVKGQRSEAASAVISAYMAHPGKMRTRTFGPQESGVKPSDRIAPANPALASSVRNRVRSALQASTR